MAALVCGLSFTVTSCKDDDDKKTEEQKAQEAQEKADRFWDVMTQLAGIDAYTPDYQGKTFEPVIGVASEGNANVRIVNTNTMEVAAQRFADLVSVGSIDEGTSSYEWKDDQVGTMTYRKTNNGQSWAVVDVNIKAMPHLQQIIYRSPEQSGQNGRFEGTAYYRFGDVVRRVYADKDDGNLVKTEFWVCVRPAFGPEGKEESHWVTISPLPKKNIFTYEHNGTKYSVPTNIGTNKEQMQNFAEMLYAIVKPSEWEKNVKANNQLKMFGDFDTSEGKQKYHNQYFWKRVQRAWQEENIYSKIFGVITPDSTALFNRLTEEDGLCLLYKGYSWWTKVSWNLTLYQAKFKLNTTDATKKNMHDVTYNQIKKSVEGNTTMNVEELYTADCPYLHGGTFWNSPTTPQYIIRHATGKELFGSKPNVYTSIEVNKLQETAGYQISPVYSYNSKYKITVNSQTEPEITTKEMANHFLEKPIVGSILANDGNFYKDVETAKSDGAEPMAIVFYLGEKNSDAVETGTTYNGLAISCQDIENVSWCKQNLSTPCTDPATFDSKITRKLFNGIAVTKQLANGCDKGHTHAVATCLKGENVEQFIDNNAKNLFNCSDWFVPSIGQWELFMKSIGMTRVENGWKGALSFYPNPNNNFTREQLMDELFDDGTKGQMLKGVKSGRGTYWLSTEADKEDAWCVQLWPKIAESGQKENTGTAYLNKNDDTYCVRPFIAFGADAKK